MDSLISSRHILFEISSHFSVITVNFKNENYDEILMIVQIRWNCFIGSFNTMLGNQHHSSILYHSNSTMINRFDFLTDKVQYKEINKQICLKIFMNGAIKSIWI